MKKHSKSKKAVVPRIDPYLEGLVAKLLERFVGLEKKMDVVIAQTMGRSAGNGDQAKPFQNLETKQPHRKERTLYEAICADCHKVCEVPFRPSEDRPVYCKECFAKRKGGGSGKPYPVLTPVALSPKPVSKLIPAETANPPARDKTKKAKKNQPEKKSKKK